MPNQSPQHDTRRQGDNGGRAQPQRRPGEMRDDRRDVRDDRRDARDAEDWDRGARDDRDDYRAGTSRMAQRYGYGGDRERMGYDRDRSDRDRDERSSREYDRDLDRGMH